MAGTEVLAEASKSRRTGRRYHRESPLPRRKGKPQLTEGTYTNVGRDYCDIFLKSSIIIWKQQVFHTRLFLLLIMSITFLVTKDENTDIWNYKKVLATFWSFFPCCASEPGDNDCDIRIFFQWSVMRRWNFTGLECWQAHRGSWKSDNRAPGPFLYDLFFKWNKCSTTWLFRHKEKNCDFFFFLQDWF